MHCTVFIVFVIIIFVIYKYEFIEYLNIPNDKNLNKYKFWNSHYSEF